MIGGFDPSQFDPKLQLLDLDRADAEDSLYVFLKSAWHIFDSAPWVDGWCIEAIADHLQAVVDGDIRRLIINIPPRCSKSAFTSVGLAPWTWSQRRHTHTSGPGVSFLYASFREDLSRRDSVNSRRIIESRWYQERWGDRFSLSDDQNTKARYNNSEGGYRLITSIESKGATGDGANIIVLDDCNSAKEVESEAVIESTLEWFDGTLGTRLNNQKLGAVIEIQQRLGENDLTGHILSKNSGDWVHLCLPMRFEKDRSFMTPIGWTDPRTEDGDLLWPERFGEEEVSGLETWLGPWRSAGQLQQRPEPRGGGIIKKDWWKLWEAGTFPPMDYTIGCLDTAYTLKQQNDPSGMIVWGVFSGDRHEQATRIVDHEGRLTHADPAYSEEATNVMLMHAWTDRYEFHELIKKVVETAIHYKIDVLLIENKAAGISVAQEIRRLYADERFGVQLFDPKSQDKFARLVSVQHLFQEGLIYAPDRKFSDAVMTQCAQFPRGKHDEYVDMTSMGLRHLRDGGLLRRKPEHVAAFESLRAYSNRNVEPLYPV
jgi:predicted phage terminase large subunit-like protein